MAVVPSLAAMAALTLFQNPHTQPEGYSVDYSAYSAPATVIQRRQRRRIGAVNRIAAGMRGFLTRVNMYLGRRPDNKQHSWANPNITATWRRTPLRLGGTRLPGHMQPYALSGGPRAHLHRRLNISRVRRRYYGSSE